MDRTTVEFSALAFQAIVTALLALVYYGLWRQRRRDYFATWGAAWGLYALRLGFISAFLVTRREGWLFAHQAAHGLVALLLLLAALQFSRGVRWRPPYLLCVIPAFAWAWIASASCHDMRIAGIVVGGDALRGDALERPGVLAATARVSGSRSALALAATFTLWGLHHLDYPLLRPLGAGVLFGVFADVLLHRARPRSARCSWCSARSAARWRRAAAQLEQLTRQLLRAQEDERRRIARELHDEAGQVLTAVKIELDLEGRSDASALVGQRAGPGARPEQPAAARRRSTTSAWCPRCAGWSRTSRARTRIEASLEAGDPLPSLAPEHQVVDLPRGAGGAHQRRAPRRRAHASRSGSARRTAACGSRSRTTAAASRASRRPHLGLLGMRERVTAARRHAVDHRPARPRASRSQAHDAGGRRA